MRSARFGAVSRLCRETLALRGANAEVEFGGCSQLSGDVPIVGRKVLALVCLTTPE